MRPRRIFRSLAVLVVAGLILAAHQGTATLVGLWEVRIQLDSASAALLRDAPREVDGQIAFRPVPSLPPGAPTTAGVYPGAFDIDVAALGIALPTSDALGWYSGRDSVRVQLSPVIDGGGLLLRGAVTADGINGRWSHRVAAGAIAGTFVMRRRTPRGVNAAS